MNRITFEQFIKTFNFRELNEYATTEHEKLNTKIIRIYFNNKQDSWFEFGVYDFGMHTWELVQKILSKEICKSYVDAMSYNTNLNVLEVYLQRFKDGRGDD